MSRKIFNSRRRTHIPKPGEMPWALEPERTFRIDITTSAPDRTISFSDNGVGMDEADIHEYLSTIGRSGTATEASKLTSAGFSPETIGQFGVGLLSAFVVADRIDVFTRKLGSETGFHWVSHGGDEYQVSPTNDAPDHGTEITLTLKREFEHFLREEDLLRMTRLFADFLSVPIYVNGQGRLICATLRGTRIIGLRRRSALMPTRVSSKDASRTALCWSSP